MSKPIGIATMEKFDNRRKNTVGSSRIRARWLLNYWNEAEEFVIGRGYDVLIYQKVYWQEMMERFDGLQLLDICDPDWLEGKPVFKFIDLVDGVVTSSQELADYIGELRPNKPVTCIPDRIYLPDHKERPKEFRSSIKSVVWFGYSQNIKYLEKTFEQLILKGIELTLISDQPYQPPLTYKSLKLENVAYDYQTINQELVKHDAVLLPTPSDDLKGKFKSNNKTLKAWALGMPVINDPDDFKRFESVEERQKESEKRLKEIETKWDVKLSVNEYQEFIKLLSGGKK